MNEQGLNEVGYFILQCLMKLPSLICQTTADKVNNYCEVGYLSLQIFTLFASFNQI